MESVLSIIIVTYNHECEIQKCLDSIDLYLTSKSNEIIIIDNHSNDSTSVKIERYRSKFNHNFSNFQFVKNSQNLGFTRGVNQGLSLASGKFLLFLNPDTEITQSSLETLIRFLSNHPSAGAVAPQLLYPDGEIQPSCRRFPKYRYLLFELTGLSRLFDKSKIFNGWKMGDFDHLSLLEVEQPQGACLMVKKNVMEEIGNLDEQFFLFFSDVDLCRRIQKSGQKIFYYPAVKIFHNKGSSIYVNRSKSIWQSHKDFIRYFLKWYRSPIQWIWNVIGIPFLYILGMLRYSVHRVTEIRSGIGNRDSGTKQIY